MPKRKHSIDKFCAEDLLKKYGCRDALMRCFMPHHRIDLQLLSELIHAGANVNVNNKCTDALPFLHSAFFNLKYLIQNPLRNRQEQLNWIKAIHLIIDAKADVNCKDAFNNVPLKLAKSLIARSHESEIYLKIISIIRKLIILGANPIFLYLENPHFCFNYQIDKQYNYLSPLDYLILQEFECYKIQNNLSNNSSTDLIHSIQGLILAYRYFFDNTENHIIISNHFKIIMQHFESAKTRIKSTTVNIPNSDGKTALHMIVKETNNIQDYINELHPEGLPCEVSEHSETRSRRLPHFSNFFDISLKFEELLLALIDAGADLNAQDKKGHYVLQEMHLNEPTMNKLKEHFESYQKKRNGVIVKNLNNLGNKKLLPTPISDLIAAYEGDNQLLGITNPLIFSTGYQEPLALFSEEEYRSLIIENTKLT